MALQLAKADITTMAVDAIVNAANRDLKNDALRRGGGVCGAIIRAAGHREMQETCDAIGHCETGETVIPEGFALPAFYVIHAVGPVYRAGDAHQAGLLRNCYLRALDLAADRHLESVAFPLISSGIYGYPGKEAPRIAPEAIQGWLEAGEVPLTVYLCLIDEDLYAMAADLLEGGKGT